MKVSSLTDSSLFILVETQEGRKFSGNARLCDAYRNARLLPTDADVECHVDLNSTSVNYSSSTSASSRTKTPSAISILTSKYSSPTAVDGPPLPPHSRKRTHVPIDVDVLVEPVAKLTRTPERDSFPHATSAAVGSHHGVGLPLKTELTEADENDIIFLPDAIQGHADHAIGDHTIERHAENALLADERSDPASHAPALDLPPPLPPLPPSAGLEQTFESLFTQNEITNDALNFAGALIPCDDEIGAGSPKVSAKKMLVVK